jgi:formylglycine-generating enzyme required for sulfatase activity
LHGVLRGGSALSDAQSVRCTFRSPFPPEQRYFARICLPP